VQPFWTPQAPDKPIVACSTREDVSPRLSEELKAAGHVEDTRETRDQEQAAVSAIDQFSSGFFWMCLSNPARIPEDPCGEVKRKDASDRASGLVVLARCFNASLTASSMHVIMPDDTFQGRIVPSTSLFHSSEAPRGHRESLENNANGEYWP